MWLLAQLQNIRPASVESLMDEAHDKSDSFWQIKTTAFTGPAPEKCTKKSFIGSS